MVSDPEPGEPSSFDFLLLPFSFFLPSSFLNGLLTFLIGSFPFCWVRLLSGMVRPMLLLLFTCPLPPDNLFPPLFFLSLFSEADFRIAVTFPRVLLFLVFLINFPFGSSVGHCSDRFCFCNRFLYVIFFPLRLFATFPSGTFPC